MPVSNKKKKKPTQKKPAGKKGKKVSPAPSSPSDATTPTLAPARLPPVNPTPITSPEPTPPVSTPPVDPWGKLKSPLGGKLSPSDSYARLVSSDRTIFGLQKVDFADANGDVDVAVEKKTASPLEPGAIESLDVINCDLTSVSISPPLLATIVSLNLSSSSLTTEKIDAILGNTGNVFLRSLTLTDNLLSDLPSPLPSKLTILELGYNKLTTIPPGSFSACKTFLYSLDLSGNQLTTIFSGLTELMHLRKLDISNNHTLQLTDVPTSPPLPTMIKQVTDLTLLPNSGLLSNEVDFELAATELTSNITGLKRFNNCVVDRAIKINQANLLSLQHEIVADDDNTKDSATCSCVEGNPCLVKYNCKPHIWHRRYEVARRAREDPNFDREKELRGN